MPSYFMRRSGVHKNVLSDLKLSVQRNMSFEGFHEKMRHQHMAHYIEKQAKLVGLQFDRKCRTNVDERMYCYKNARTHTNISVSLSFESADPKLWRLSEYDDRKGYGGSVPSANLLNQMFLHDYIQREPYIKRSMQRVRVDSKRMNRRVH